MIVDFNDETNTFTDEQLNELKQLIKFTLKQEKFSSHCEVSLSFVTDERIRQLNKQYRHIDEPTDVLSFPLIDLNKESIEQVDQNKPLSLGDIIISIDRAHEQKERYGHSFKREISFLVVHGLLHLLGYDHDTEEKEKEMFKKQEEILGAFKIERK